jgi:hypothetical protein
MAQPQMMPISTDSQTQSQVAGILLLREADRIMSDPVLQRYDRLLDLGYPACDSTYLVAMCENG